MSNFDSQPNHDSNKNRKSSKDIVGSYFQDIIRIPLLTAEEEISLAKQVQQRIYLLTLKEELSEKLQRQPTIQEWSVQAQLSDSKLLEHLKQGQLAKQKMIAANLRWVVTIAKKYQKRNLDFLDLIQEGTLGLERAVDKFKPALGYKFSTYAYWWIRQGITRAISQQSRTIRLPIHVTEKLNKIKRVQRELSQKLGRNPTVTEISEILGLKPSQIREYLHLARQPMSLDVRVGALDYGKNTIMNQNILGNKQDIHLTNKEFQLLEYFMKHPNQILTTEQIRNQLWEVSAESSSNVVAAQVRLLRRKLMSNGCGNPIETLHGMGYRFNFKNQL